MGVPQTARALLGHNIPVAQLRDLCILGYLVQLNASYVYIANDIGDQSTTRQGFQSWWSQYGVGHSAISDAFILNSCIYHLLRYYFQEHPAYLSFIHIFHDTSLSIEIGQSAAHVLASANEPTEVSRFSTMTEENRDFIITHKSGYFLSLPPVIALTYLQMNNPRNVAQVEELCFSLARYTQIQNDFLDVFQPPEARTGRSSDIQRGKCSWLLIQALQRCSPEQRQVLEEAYGMEDEQQAQRVRDIYMDLFLDKVFHEYESGFIEELEEVVHGVDHTDRLMKWMLDVVLGELGSDNSYPESIEHCN